MNSRQTFTGIKNMLGSYSVGNNEEKQCPSCYVAFHDSEIRSVKKLWSILKETSKLKEILAAFKNIYKYIVKNKIALFGSL